MYSVGYIRGLLRTYTCDYENNKECKAKYCILNNGPCSRTTKYKYAKKNVINYIKKIINKIRGRYKYE